MKAVIYRTYGSPDVLHCEETEKPRPGDDEVLIRICAAAVQTQADVSGRRPGR
jgi:NADPH:quinone reductase-like Zn-dependent oxidoreductase